MSEATRSAPAEEVDVTDRGDPTKQPSTGELVVQASAQLTDLVRSEMELARAELQESVKSAATGAGLFGAAGLVALYGGGALVATAIIALALVMDAWVAALIVTVVLFAVAGIAALVGRKQVQQVKPPLQNSVDSVKRDVQTLKGGGQR